MHFGKRIFIAPTFLLLAVVGCVISTGPAEPATAHELAALLRAKGIAYDVAEAINDGRWEFAEVAEGLTLKGDRLYLEILRIEDPETFAAAEEARLRYTALRGGGIVWEREDPVEIYSRPPYIVVVRAEPVEGQVVNILREVLPKDYT